MQVYSVVVQMWRMRMSGAYVRSQRHVVFMHVHACKMHAVSTAAFWVTPLHVACKISRLLEAAYMAPQDLQMPLINIGTYQAC